MEVADAKAWAVRVDSAMQLPEQKKRQALVELLLESQRDRAKQQDEEWAPLKQKFRELAGAFVACVGVRVVLSSALPPPPLPRFLLLCP